MKITHCQNIVLKLGANKSTVIEISKKQGKKRYQGNTMVRDEHTPYFVPAFLSEITYISISH